jgi:hypothetical protein
VPDADSEQAGSPTTPASAIRWAAAEAAVVDVDGAAGALLGIDEVPAGAYPPAAGAVVGVGVVDVDGLGEAVGSAAGFVGALGRAEAGEAAVGDGAGLAERAGFVGEAAGASEGAEVDDDATPVALGRGARS